MDHEQIANFEKGEAVDSAADIAARHLTVSDRHLLENVPKSIDRQTHLQTECVREAGEQGKDQPNKSTFKERPL